MVSIVTICHSASFIRLGQAQQEHEFRALCKAPSSLDEWAECCLMSLVPLEPKEGKKPERNILAEQIELMLGWEKRQTWAWAREHSIQISGGSGVCWNVVWIWLGWRLLEEARGWRRWMWPRSAGEDVDAPEAILISPRPWDNGVPFSRPLLCCWNKHPLLCPFPLTFHRI